MKVGENITLGVRPEYLQPDLATAIEGEVAFIESQGGGTVLSEDVAAIEVTALIEMIMDRGVDGGKLLKSLYVPELRHCTLSSSKGLV